MNEHGWEVFTLALLSLTVLWRAYFYALFAEQIPLTFFTSHWIIGKWIDTNFFARINGGGTDRWLFWYPHWHRGKTLIPKQSASKIPVLDPDRRVDAKCFSVCSSAKSYFQPFSIFLLSFPYHRQNDTILQTILGCLFHLLVHPMRKDRLFPPPTPVCFSLSLTLKKIFYIHIIVIQSCKSLLAIRRILAFWVSIYHLCWPLLLDYF